MRIANITVLSLLLAATPLALSPAHAQGKSKAKAKQSEVKKQESRDEHRRPELRRRAEDRDQRDRDEREDDRHEQRDDRRYDYDERFDNRYERRDGKRVPPGWCKGRGNPHNTPENCGYDRDRRYDWDGPYERRDDRYDPRDPDSRSGSYAEAHRRFHDLHDRQCRDRAAQRPLDIEYQIRVRSECKATHERWHERAGRGH